MAQKYNLTIDQGTTFTIDFAIKDATNTAIDLTGFSGRGQLRYDFTSTTATADFTVAISTPANGVVRLLLTDTITTSITPGRYVYDVELISGDSNVYRIVQGNVTVYPEVTKTASSSSSSSSG